MLMNISEFFPLLSFENFSVYIYSTAELGILLPYYQTWWKSDGEAWQLKGQKN